MNRKKASWKLPFIHPIFFKKRNVLKKSLKLKLRNSVIPADYVNKRIRVYNGIWFLSQDVNTNMIGYKLGQFSYTKRSDLLMHSKWKKKGKKKKK